MLRSNYIRGPARDRPPPEAQNKFTKISPQGTKRKEGRLMKNTALKKFGALFVSGVMVLAMSATAFAAEDMAGEGGVIGEFSTPDTPEANLDTSVTIYKEITAYNPEACTVNAPTITYSYSIAAGSAGKDIYDVSTAHSPAANVHATTKAGIGSPTITSSVVLNPNVQLNASSTGEKNTFPLKINFDGVFTGAAAGVYRYVITETCSDAAKTAAGIADGSITDTRYMDVYVDGSGRIYGYVCFAYDNNIDARDSAAAADKVDKAFKTEGFVAGTDTASGSAVTADSYYTFNFTLSKTLVNDAFSTSHEFPFTVTLANSTVTAAVLPIMTTSGNATQAALTAGAIDGTWNPRIADGGEISYVGIPCGTTVTINETNDVTGVTYSSESTGADTNAAVKNIFTSEVSNNAVINCGATACAAARENHNNVVFTNTLLQISPTGIALRFTPFAIMLTAGVFFVVLAKKSRREDED